MRAIRAALCVVVTSGLFSTVALAQGQSLPSSFRQQAAMGPQDLTTIDTFVKAQVEKLAGTDAAGQAAARETLVAAGTGSPAFGDAYGKSLNDALVQVEKSGDWRAKLNAAIVAAKVAEKIENDRLHDAALAFIGDKDESILLWGIKTAKAVVPAMFNAQGAAASDDLVKAVSNAAMTHPSGAIASEAYETLAPKATTVKNVQPLVKATLPSLLKLMAARNKMYMTGVPEEPTAESGALTFLSLEQVWNTLTAEDKAAAMQQISDLVGMAGQRAAGAGRVDEEHITPLLVRAAKALQVIGSRPDVSSEALVTAAATLARVNPATPAANISSWTAAIYPALKAAPLFGNLTPPPTVSPSAPQPAAAPATTKSAQ